ncbi:MULTISPECIES: SDR family NAD(P)-dependent oxidoreductase [Roseomonadaceae]|uniref:SDR family oxidoreductase n=1 Tax=Falsiroseomonas oleicola TaxID=2801474 RepID=A0ABS6H9V3_9PROT|nr:SDR family NAD(P)-dependent oxidoreductase [Roseomonas oleicola]MBU8544271.1 SDR family oxidoreductase [Roseomonas oleicola]
MQIRLDGRTALITGGSKGLGLAIAESYVESGAAVALVARGEEALASAKARILGKFQGARVAAISADVGTAEGCAQAARQAAAELGPVDILVNNAGTSQRGPFMEVDDALWQADLDLKLFAAIRLTRAVWPGMQERRWGRIINVLNIGAKAPAAGGAPTAVSRAAGMALTKILAGEGAPHNILVNGMLVGIIESDQWVRRHAADPRGISWEDWKAEQGKAVPMGRIGKAEEFAAMATFLASEQGGYVTGTAINVDGGRSPVV